MAFLKWIDAVVDRALGRIVATVPPVAGSRKVSFTGLPLERAQPVPDYSEKALAQFAAPANSRFPSLTEPYL